MGDHVLRHGHYWMIDNCVFGHSAPRSPDHAQLSHKGRMHDDACCNSRPHLTAPILHVGGSTRYRLRLSWRVWHRCFFLLPFSEGGWYDFGQFSDFRLMKTDWSSPRIK